MIRIVVLFFLIVHAQDASALGMKDYERGKGTDVFELHINGVGQGYSFANAWLSIKGRPQIYCGPKEGLKAKDYLLILEREMNDTEFIKGMPPDMPLEAILLQGLINNFPCK
jgi:hypothetical protein